MYNYVVYKYPSLNNPDKYFDASVFKLKENAEKGFESAVNVATELSKSNDLVYTIKLIEVKEYKESIIKKVELKNGEQVKQV